MSFYRDTIRTARKEHKCEVCHGIIMKGEKYHDKAGNEDDLWYQKECEKCQPAIWEYLAQDSDWGYCDESIQEWWGEEKCPKCIKYYQDCKPTSDCFLMCNYGKDPFVTIVKTANVQLMIHVTE